MTEATPLEAKRAALAARLENLRMAPEIASIVQKADKAVRDFKSQVADAESQLAAVESEIGALEQHKRAEAERDRQAQRATQRQQLVDEHDAFLGYVETAERATRALAKATEEIFAANARIATLARELSPDRKAPMACNPMELAGRVATRIAAVMSTIKGHRNRLGPLQWPAGAIGLYPPDQTWRQDFEKRLWPPFNPSSKGADDHDQGNIRSQGCRQGDGARRCGGGAEGTRDQAGWRQPRSLRPGFTQSHRSRA
jgi:hypothetical protein